MKKAFDATRGQYSKLYNYQMSFSKVTQEALLL
jgi:hypothetical protein